jgi:hypothetical protein
MQAFRDLRQQTHAYLDKIAEGAGDEGLDAPTKCQPLGFSGFETIGAAIQIIACHASGHMGA